ncbi:MAG: YgcG family protein [Pseudomonadota bacterium]
MLCALAGFVQAQDRVAVPPLRSPVTDLTGTLKAEQVAQLASRLRAFEDRKGSQLAVLILPTTQPESIEQYAIRVAEQWKLGRKRVDDGAILVVTKNDRALRIEVGYGLEGVLNDATAKRIVDDIIVPRFKQDDFYGGIAAGIDSMMKVVDGEPLPAPAPAGSRDTQVGVRHMLPLFLVIAVVLGGILRAVLGRVAGATITGGVIGAVAWMIAGTVAVAMLSGALGFLFTLIGGGGAGLAGLNIGRGNGSGGDGGWSGGGGGFGGGGASGRW